MGELVNLRQARKRAARGAKEAQAIANRAAFGVPKGARTIARRESNRAESRLDAHRLGSGASNGETDVSG